MRITESFYGNYYPKPNYEALRNYVKTFGTKKEPCCRNCRHCYNDETLQKVKCMLDAFHWTDTDGDWVCIAHKEIDL